MAIITLPDLQTNFCIENVQLIPIDSLICCCSICYCCSCFCCCCYCSWFSRVSHNYLPNFMEISVCRCDRMRHSFEFCSLIKRFASSLNNRSGKIWYRNAIGIGMRIFINIWIWIMTILNCKYYITLCWLFMLNWWWFEFWLIW